MMPVFRKIAPIILLLALAASFWLAACAAETPVSVTETPAASVFVTPDASQAIPAAGFVTVRVFEGMQALRLHSQPDQSSALAGLAVPGEKGKLLGLDATRSWALVKFETQSGWAPVPTLDLVIAE